MQHGVAETQGPGAESPRWSQEATGNGKDRESAELWESCFPHHLCHLDRILSPPRQESLLL